jgi:hypothetical protein
MWLRLGKSRSVITETLTLASMPEDVRNLCRLADIQSKSTLLQIVRQSDPGKMIDMLGGSSTKDDPEEARRLAREGRAPSLPRDAEGYVPLPAARQELQPDDEVLKGHVSCEEIAKTLGAGGRALARLTAALTN